MLLDAKAARVAAPFHQLVRVGVGSAHRRSPDHATSDAAKERTARQLMLFTENAYWYMAVQHVYTI